MSFGWHHSIETKKKMSIANSGENHPLYGTHRSEETKKKQSISCKKPKSIPRSKEHNLKIGLSHKGKVRSEIWKKHISLSKIGKYRGPNCSAWKGGISFEPYCPKFNEEFKGRVRAFFGYQCQECGHVWHEGERKLAVHHVNFQKDACCSNEVTPLFVPLCQVCHSKTNFNRIFWQYWFTEMINRLYNGQCYIPKTSKI